MHSYLSSFFTIALLFSTCLSSACAFPSAPANLAPQINESHTIDVGLVPINQIPAPEYISFREVKGNLEQRELRSFNKFPNTTRILFIRGGNLDKSGNAERWVFGVRTGGTNELIVYDRSGWTTISWSGVISADEIDLDRVISPEAIFNQSSNQILGNSPSTMSAQRDIELKNGTYKITITSGSISRILMFNATTGVAIE